MSRQRSAQAECAEMWNLHAGGEWNAREGERMRGVRTKIEPDHGAMNAMGAHESFENRQRQARLAK